MSQFVPANWNFCYMYGEYVQYEYYAPINVKPHPPGIVQSTVHKTHPFGKNIIASMYMNTWEYKWQDNELIKTQCLGLQEIELAA